MLHLEFPLFEVADVFLCQLNVRGREVFGAAVYTESQMCTLPAHLAVTFVAQITIIS